jgi:CDP-glycerol glycerophosphotransferase (TagB/SpsB family)
MFPFERFDIHMREETSFAEDLAAADLLVTFSSTTLFDAIHARKPVLLWGGTDRYRRMPARTVLPTPSDRSAIYAVGRAADLGPMIAAILDAHAGRQLTDDEIRDYVWPEGTPTMTDLAEAIAAGDYRRTWVGPRN